MFPPMQVSSVELSRSLNAGAQLDGMPAARRSRVYPLVQLDVKFVV